MCYVYVYGFKFWGSKVGFGSATTPFLKNLEVRKTVYFRVEVLDLIG